MAAPDQIDLFADDPEHKPIAPPPPRPPKAPKPKREKKEPVELLPAEPIGKRRQIYVGTCSWSDPSLIQSKRFYPPGFGSAEKRLQYYATRFPIVEVDSSFFAMPQASNSALWVQRTPPHFVFNIKAFRAFTGHQIPPASLPPDIRDAMPPLTGRAKNYYYKDLPAEIRTELWRRFIEAVTPLRESGKLRAVHFQFSPWVTAGAESRAHIEECVDRMRGYQLAVEFRNRSWLNERDANETLAWERELQVAHVVVDEPKDVGNFGHGVWAVTNPKLAVVRLHGRNDETWKGKELTASSERFNYEYSPDELRALAERMKVLAEDAFELQVLLNVNFEDQGIRAADALLALLAELDAPNTNPVPGE
ncbi:DUF72 domain-containing protein [Sphaerotilaceae bacterium SBD11-9]